MAVNYHNNGTGTDTDFGTLYAKYNDTDVTKAITTKTTTASNFSYKDIDLASTFVKYSDLAPNNMKGTKGSANGFFSNNYTGDLGTNFVVVGTVEYLLRVSLGTATITQTSISQSWSILTGASVFGSISMVFTTGQLTISGLTENPVIINSHITVTPNTQYTYYLTPYTSGGVATSSTSTVTVWTPPTIPTIGGTDSALASSSGSVNFDFEGTYDYVYLYTSTDNANFSTDSTQYHTGNVFSLPTTSPKTTYFYIVPYDHNTGGVNSSYKSANHTFTVSDGTAVLGTTTGVSSTGFTINITGSNIASVSSSSTGAGTGTASSTSGSITFSGLNANTSYSPTITVTLQSGTTITLSPNVKTSSNLVVGDPAISNVTSSGFTVTISATNTSTVSDGTNAYTSSGDNWSYTYSGLTAGTKYDKTLTITGNDSSTQTKSASATTQFASAAPFEAVKYSIDGTNWYSLPGGNNQPAGYLGMSVHTYPFVGNIYDPSPGNQYTGAYYVQLYGISSNPNANVEVLLVGAGGTAGNAGGGGGAVYTGNLNPGIYKIDINDQTTTLISNSGTILCNAQVGNSGFTNYVGNGSGSGISRINYFDPPYTYNGFLQISYNGFTGSYAHNGGNVGSTPPGLSALIGWCGSGGGGGAGGAGGDGTGTNGTYRNYGNGGDGGAGFSWKNSNPVFGCGGGGSGGGDPDDDNHGTNGVGPSTLYGYGNEFGGGGSGATGGSESENKGGSGGIIIFTYNN